MWYSVSRAARPLFSRAALGRSVLGCGLVAMAAPSPGTPSRALSGPALPAEPPAPGRVKMALLQVAVGSDKASNLVNAGVKVREAAAAGAKLIMLPECFNSPYGANFFPEYAEEIPSSNALIDKKKHPSTHLLCSTASELGIYLVGGSIPERDGATGNIYNTCVVVGPDGSILCKHRKVHLFDIDVPGKIRFFESETLTGGDDLSIFDTPWGRVGVGICYDIRFPQLAELMRNKGAHLLCYPGAFNRERRTLAAPTPPPPPQPTHRTRGPPRPPDCPHAVVTGPLHWELLARARAVDNQVFVATPSPARDMSAGYHAWGHSSVIDPWGKVVATTEETPATIYAEVDLAETAEPRQAIPVFDQKRDDLYETSWSGEQ